MLTTADNHIPVLLHDTDAGEPCLVCREDCPGLEIHFWRKICINCKCPVSDHQATNDEQITQVRRGKQLDENVRAQFECSEYAWIPPGLTTDMVEEYMKLLPPEQRPVVGTVGEQYRRKLLMTQLPSHDHNPSSSLSPAEAEELVEFSRLRYELSYGVAEVKRVTEQQSEMFDCRTCQSPLEAGQLAVITERAGPNCIWCATCFKCDVCEEALADLHYFYKDGELFCGRHHAELLKPRCAACDELILAKEYTLAEDKNWHIDHFCCWECDSPLGGQRYVTRDDHPFCILCYEELFAPPCKKCVLPIGLDSAHMVHRDYHWHATESCFFCENCQVSLITSPFLLKFEEIFCSSTCAQEYSLSQLADKPVNKVPQIEIIEDNPVDRNSIHSILRKESTPSPPKQLAENGTTPRRKVMFDVEQEQLDVPSSQPSTGGEIKRSMSEEEFEYLERTLNDTGDSTKEESPSPLSESSLSTSPLSDTPNTEFFDAVPDNTKLDNTNHVETGREQNDFVPDNQTTESVNHDIEPNAEISVNHEPDEAVRLTFEEPVSLDLNQNNSLDNGALSVDNEEEEVSTPRGDHVSDQDIVSPKTPDIIVTQDILADFAMENHDVVNQNDVSQEEPDIPAEMSEIITNWENTRAVDPVCDINVMSPDPIVMSPDPVVLSDKENDMPSSENRTIFTDDLQNKPPKKPARGKLSSASFNRVLRKIDHTGNDSLFVERPGKRLRHRPRSLSSLSTNTRGQNTIEQKDNLVNMFALAPDIADMIANVYKNTNSINTTIKSNDCAINRTLGASSPLCSGSAHSSPRAERSLHKRNPSYEAAELVMQLDVESEGEEEEKHIATTKHITLSDDPTVVTDVPVKTPKKGIKERLSFKKKKDKSASPQKQHNPDKPPRKQKKACIVM